MSTSINAAPRSILEGIQDVSGTTPIILPDQIPTHCPHLFFFAERGDTLPNLLVGDGLTRMYGAKTFDLRSKFATHQTVLATEVNAAGNRFFAQRVIPNDAAPRATIQLSCDILPVAVPLYERNVDGSLKLDNLGNVIPVLDDEDEPVTVAGHKVKWVAAAVPQYNKDGEVITQQMINDHLTDPDIDITPVANALGQSSPSQGDQADPANSTISTRYPIFEGEIAHIGSYGNLIGFRLSASTLKSTITNDNDLSNEIKSFLYRMQFVQSATANSTPLIWENLNGGQDVLFSFKENTFNPRTNVEYYWDDVIVQNYTDIDTDVTPVYGPFGRVHVYDENFKTIAGMIAEAESAVNVEVSAEEEDLFLINPVSCVDLNGNSYQSVEFVGAQGGGVLFNEIATHFARGGSDGTMTFDTFDALVAEQVANYGDLEANMLNSAKYPVSALYDTGFKLDTKKKFFTPIGRRKDVAVFVCTQDVSLSQNTVEEESSIAAALITAARLYPESEIYGTSTCRAFIVGHSGYLLSSPYKGLLPIVIELGSKLAKYMGAGNGIWDNGAAIDVEPNNRISMFRDVNHPFKPASVYAKDWKNGLIAPQSFDRRSNFIPAFRSVYDDETSILVSGINVLIAVNLQRVAEEVWREMVGNATLTNDQWVEQSDLKIGRKVRNRYDGRVVIRPETYFTDEDANNGFSNHCKIHMYGNNMKTQTTFTVVAHRRSDLE